MGWYEGEGRGYLLLLSDLLVLILLLLEHCLDRRIHSVVGAFAGCAHGGSDS